jgi:hypothetical protein
MLKTLVAGTVSLLTACSSVPSTDPIFYSKTKTIQWRKVPNVNEYCQQAMPHKKLKENEVFYGCAVWSRVESKCIIVTGYTDNLNVIGHELKHCFAGEFH